MNLPELKNLLEKYYDGESSRGDQERISELLADSNLPKEYYPDREMFKYLDEDEAIPEPDAGFEGRIMKRIDWNDKEKGIATLKRRVYTVTSAAAAVLILIATYLVISVNNRPEDTFDDPLVAYNETRRLLYEVSANLNKGYKELGNLAYFSKAVSSFETIGESRKIVARELGSLKYLERGIELSDLVGSAKENE
ncbi:MAG TPA: hypothetical protein VMW76_04725 [Bacteroidales bacterium]|nr:hypothetical protein [Bacteroidales bacterium]